MSVGCSVPYLVSVLVNSARPRVHTLAGLPLPTPDPSPHLRDELTENITTDIRPSKGKNAFQIKGERGHRRQRKETQKDEHGRDDARIRQWTERENADSCIRSTKGHGFMQNYGHWHTLDMNSSAPRAALASTKRDLSTGSTKGWPTPPTTMPSRDDTPRDMHATLSSLSESCSSLSIGCSRQPAAYKCLCAGSAA